MVARKWKELSESFLAFSSRQLQCHEFAKTKECAKTFLTFMTHWANTKKAYPNIIPCRIRREKSRRKKPFVRKFVLVFISFCCASESVNEQLGLPVKKRMRSQKCAGKTLSFVRLMSPMQWLSFFHSNLSGRKSNITVKNHLHGLANGIFLL